MCAQVILDTTQLEGQQELLLARFKENKELLDEVREGMSENLNLAKENINYLKKAGQSNDEAPKVTTAAPIVEAASSVEAAPVEKIVTPVAEVADVAEAAAAQPSE